jgi:hypothetical protein
MNHRARHLLSLILLLSPFPAVAQESYDAAIDQAVRALGCTKQEKEETLRRELVGSQKPWPERESYARVREMVAELPEARRQFRLEIGNVNMGVYQVVWVVETEKEVVAFSNVFSGREMQRVHVPPARWEKLLDLLTASREKVAGCRSDLSYSDGTTFFGTISVDGPPRQFAFYGGVTFPGEPAETAATSPPCGEIVYAAYELVWPGKTRRGR